MDFIELAKLRYSSRNYKEIEVEDDMLAIVLEAGRIAPSAANYQPWYFIVVKGENKQKLKECYHREWFKKAPVYIVLCADHSRSWKRADGKDHADIDVAIACDHMTLAATSIGLATCWICNFDQAMLAKVLELPAHIEPVVILTLAYPADAPDTARHSTKRKELKEIVYFEKFGKN